MVVRRGRAGGICRVRLSTGSSVQVVQTVQNVQVVRQVGKNYRAATFTGTLETAF
jgi:hypothetical protein